MLIHIKRNAEVFGPYSIEEAREYLSSGRLSLSDFAQMPGTTEWIPLGSVPGVRSAPPPPPPSSADLPGIAPVSTHEPLLSEASARGISYAGFWIRFGASLIDAVILWPIGLLCNFLLASQAGAPATVPAVQFAAGILGCLLDWVYRSALMSCPWQATIGMKACGLKITDESGNRISFGRATGRWFAIWLSGCPTLGIGFLMIAWTKRKQGLHDIIARTLVVYSGGSAKLVPAYDQPTPRPPSDPPVRRNLEPPVLGVSETKQQPPTYQRSPWSRAIKPAGVAFFIGAFAFISLRLYPQPTLGLSFGARMLAGLFSGLCFSLIFFGLLTYLVAVLVYARKPEPNRTVDLDALKAGKKTRNLVWIGVFSAIAVLCVISVSKPGRQAWTFLWLGDAGLSERSRVSQPSTSPAGDATEPDAKAKAAAQFEKDFYEKYPDLKPYSSLCDAVAAKLYQSGGNDFLTLTRDERMQAFAKGAREVVALQQAAERGDAVAQFNLGLIYGIGSLLPQDNTEAVKWLRRSAEQGLPRALGSLGAMYYKGTGVPQDLAEAVRWFRMAADKGDAHSQGFLGVLYEKGSGVAQDYVEAYRWYSLSAAQGDTNAIAAQASIYPKSVVAFENEFYARYSDLRSNAAIANWAANQAAANGLRGTKEQLMEAFSTAARQEVNRLAGRITEIQNRVNHPTPLPAPPRANFPTIAGLNVNEVIDYNNQREAAIDAHQQRMAAYDESDRLIKQEWVKYQLVGNQTGLGQAAILALSSGSSSGGGQPQAELFRDYYARQEEEAKNGHPTAQYNLGLRYLKGEGVTQDKQLALRWIRTAATNQNKEFPLSPVFRNEIDELLSQLEGR